MPEATITENTCPVQAYIRRTIDQWKARLHALMAFKRVAERYHDKPVEKLESDPAAREAVQAILGLPFGFNDPPKYRVRAPRSIRVDARRIDEDIAFCEQKIKDLDDASTHDFSEVIEAKRAFNAALARLGPNAQKVWLSVAAKI